MSLHERVERKILVVILETESVSGHDQQILEVIQVEMIREHGRDASIQVIKILSHQKRHFLFPLLFYVLHICWVITVSIITDSFEVQLMS